MAHLPQKGSPPPRPPSPLSATAKTRDLGRTWALNINRRQCCSIYLLKKLDSNDFKPKQIAAKFSANIISATVYLFVGKSGLADIKNFSTPFFHRLWITFPTILGKTGSFPQAIIFICVSAVYFQNSDQISRFSASFAMQTKFN